MTTDHRAVSSTLGVVLLFSLVIGGMVLTVALGATALDDTKDELGADRAEKTLTQLDSKSAVVALGGTDRQTVSLPDSGGTDYRIERERGWMNVSITNTTSEDVTPVMNTTLGAVVYENDQTEIAYQGGGVWKSTAGGERMVSPPEFHWRNATLTLPIVAVSGEGTIGDRVAVSKNGSTRKRYPNSTLDESFTNPLENGKVNVTVRSEYYRAWGQYFEQRTQGEVHYDHDREVVTITLVVPSGGREVRSAVASTADGGSLTLSGSGAFPSRTDSYTSADSTGYDPSENTVDGNITFGGDVTVTGNACVVGSIKSGDTVSVSGSPCAGDKVAGDVRHAENPPPSPGQVGGDVIKIDDFETDSSVNGMIDDQIDAIEDNPDSDGDISASDTLDFSEDGTLTAGSYHLDRFVVPDGETLELDTSSGDIEIAVEEFISILGSVDVVGDNRVKVYVEGTSTTSCTGGAEPDSCHLHMDSGSSVTTPAQNASKFWVYAKSDHNAKFRGPSTFAHFEGVWYAPGGTSGTGEVYIEKAEIFGGIVASKISVNQGGEFHYDRGLRETRAIPKNEKIVRITYLHISLNRVNVTSV